MVPSQPPSFPWVECQPVSNLPVSMEDTSFFYVFQTGSWIHLKQDPGWWNISTIFAHITKIIKLLFVVFRWFGIVREPGQEINHHSNQDCLAKRWDERLDILRKGSGPRRCFQTFGQQIYIILIYYHYITLHDLTWSSIIFHDIISLNTYSSWFRNPAPPGMFSKISEECDENTNLKL